MIDATGVKHHRLLALTCVKLPSLKVGRDIIEVDCSRLLLQVFYAFDSYLSVFTLRTNLLS